MSATFHSSTFEITPAESTGPVAVPQSQSVSPWTTFAQLWEALGNVPLERIQLTPPPGLANEEDAADSRHKLGVSCELFHGVLVAKPMGYYESQIAMALAHFLHVYLDSNPLGVLAGEDGPIRILPSITRKPDLSLILLDRFASRKVPRRKVMHVAPDLAVEVLSAGNTKAEMEIKLREYFSAGVRLVWYIDPESQSARAFTATDRREDISPTGSLKGGDVLPGFELPLARLFEKAGPRDEE